MIPISKEQAAYLRAAVPGVRITTLCRKKSKGVRKHRLVEEYSVVRKALETFRQSDTNGKEVKNRGTERNDGF